MLKLAAQSLRYGTSPRLTSRHAWPCSGRWAVAARSLPLHTRNLSTSLARRHNSQPATTPTEEQPSSSGSSSLAPPQEKLQLDPLEPRLSLTFTCTADECHQRSTHTFTKRSYERGIVIVQCPGCKNRHLIADHLGWFKESTEEGKLRTVEDLLRARGEKVRRGRLDAGGVMEYSE